jgi:hypothetical protein
MADFKALFEKIKNSKYGMPILIGGTVVGGYIILKSTSGSGGNFASQLGQAQSAIDKANEASEKAAGSGGSGGSGGSDNSAGIAALQEQQSGFFEGITKYFNEFATQIGAAVGDSQAQTQGAIDRLFDAQMSASENAASIAPEGIGALPDFSSLFAGVSETIRQQTAYQPTAPQLNLGNTGGLNSAVQRLGAKAIKVKPQTNQRFIQTTTKLPKVKTPPSNIKAPTRRTIIPKTRGTITPTFNSPNIQSRGGFGGSKIVAKPTVKAPKPKKK